MAEKERKASLSAMITADGVVVKFGNIVALNSFSATIPRGIVGLLGPNGAGKSTFIKACLGLVEVEAGAISVASMDPQKNYMAVRDAIGYMPENDCLPLSMDAIQAVSYFGRLSGMPRKDAIQRAHEVLDFVGIGEERYRPIEGYSTGMKQRVKLAQAIAHDPEILFLDEPTNGMDPQGREEMLELIKKIGSYNKTLLVSSHILHEVEKVSDHVVIINEGRMVKSGSINTLMAGNEDQIRIKVRGRKERIKKFRKRLGKNYRIVSSEDEGGVFSFVVEDVPSASVFEAARETGVQVRYIGPATITLEDVFLNEVRGGVV